MKVDLIKLGFNVASLLILLGGIVAVITGSLSWSILSLIMIAIIFGFVIWMEHR